MIFQDVASYTALTLASRMLSLGTTLYFLGRPPTEINRVAVVLVRLSVR
jgi:hypothetical protein